MLYVTVTEPVSYTHLDVYKRQVYKMTNDTDPDGSKKAAKKKAKEERRRR